MLGITEKTNKPIEFIAHPIDGGNYIRFRIDDVFNGK